MHSLRRLTSFLPLYSPCFGLILAMTLDQPPTWASSLCPFTSLYSESRLSFLRCNSYRSLLSWNYSNCLLPYSLRFIFKSYSAADFCASCLLRDSSYSLSLLLTSSSSVGPKSSYSYWQVGASGRTNCCWLSGRGSQGQQQLGREAGACSARVSPVPSLKQSSIFKTSDKSIIIVKMMKTQHSTLRSTSNSTESLRLKKSTSTFATKMKSSISNITSSMESGVKQTRVNTSSKSNKKGGLMCNNSNKSLKSLNQTQSQSRFDNTRRIGPRKIEAVVGNERKGPTMNIKNMKQKALGNLPSTMINSYKVHTRCTEEKQNEEYPKKYGQNSNVDNKLYAPEPQCKKSSRQNTNPNQSIFNFSSMLIPRDGEELSLSQFEVGRKLGKGRFGDVYMARDLRTGFALAIKMINKKDVKEAGMQSQVAQQIKIQLFSNHPNVLKLYGFFSDNSKIYLLLELATHGCLFKQIRNRNYCEQNLASFYFRQVAGAVRYLHSLYVIHRDIKPENILNCFNVLKVCDFGWAAYSPLYQRQTFCGTLDYVPPEIVTGDFYDERADVWCLGVLCYELCTGRAPFQSKRDQNETYDRILKVDIEFPIYLSAQVADFIGKILNRDPIKRMGLQQVQSHEWMRKYQNEAGRMIPKEIWQAWTRLARGE